ncbi:TPA: methionine adenosyltransferase [bacterium]|jgi:S-adenosylmethionine synthetase|nr:methionine adenosyltransferase [bacterium]
MSYLNLFTSESVGPGHPDKICDQLSDAILDACYKEDDNPRVAAECFITTDTVIIGGEISTKASIDYEKIVRETLLEIGYSNKEYGIDARTCKIINLIKKQSPDIALGVNNSTDISSIGAGDQGMMFGYATDETSVYMPLPIHLAHSLVKRADELRKINQLKYARPDMKSQVTIDYSGNVPRIHTILMSVQHDDDYVEEEFKQNLIEKVMNYVAKENNLNTDFNIIINPTGRFVIGGPEGDTGLTGRKIIVDTYGGSAHHGGGAFSGKDCTKVDRSAAYMARYLAKNIVAAKLAKKCEIQLAYAIGKSHPVSLHVNTFNTGAVSDEIIIKAIKDNFELTPAEIIKVLDLRRPIYKKTATFGHFGRNEEEFTWERLDLVEKFQKYLTK